MQRIAVIGLGRFGTSLSRLLAQQRIEVIAVDRNHRLVDEVKDEVTLAVSLDATDEDALSSHEIHRADVCVVAIGENFEASLLAATALKKLGARYVIVRAQTATHAEIFRRLGADEIIQPETEAGRYLARRLANPHLEDVIELSGGYALIELRAPAAFVGKSLEQLGLRNKYRVNLVAVKRQQAIEAGEAAQPAATTYVPSANYTIQADDVLLLVGTDAALNGLPK
ncbi:MAG TPA: TrkA family potassium uptake protein [Pirellulaceae bacterium]|nr:TrkA family potassium uptake protein [Pirellulaceae bacterium]